MKKIVTVILVVFLLSAYPVTTFASIVPEHDTIDCDYDCEHVTTIIIDTPFVNANEMILTGATRCCGREDLHWREIITHSDATNGARCLVSHQRYLLCHNCGATHTDTRPFTYWHTHQT